MKNIHIILIALAIILSSCNQKPIEDTAENKSEESNIIMVKPEQIALASVKSEPLVLGQIPIELQLNGKAIPGMSGYVIISHPYGGTINSQVLLPGSDIAIGQTLATIKNDNLILMQRDYLKAKAKLEFSDKDLKRQKELNEANANSNKTLQQAEYEFQSIKAEASALQSQLELAGINWKNLNPDNITSEVKILAPFSGKVGSVYVTNGQYIQPTDKIAELINASNSTIALSASGSEAGYLKSGMSVKIEIPDSDKNYDAEIIQISPIINEDNLVTVICKLTNGIPIKTGSYVKGIVKAGNVAGFIVPSESIINWQNEHYIFLDKSDAQYEMFKIKLEYITDSIAAFTADPSISTKKYVSQNAYTLLMALKNKNEE